MIQTMNGLAMITPSLTGRLVGQRQIAQARERQQGGSRSDRLILARPFMAENQEETDPDHEWSGYDHTVPDGTVGRTMADRTSP